MRRLVDSVVQLWRDRVWGPKLQTYDKAREDLGGVPWRIFSNTQRWFVPPPAPAAAMARDSRPLTLDTGALVIDGGASLLDFLRRVGKGTWLAGAGAVLVLLVLVFSGGKSPAPTAVAAAPVAAAPVPAVAAVAPAVAPTTPIAMAQATPRHAAGSPRMSSSVKALFGAGKSSRGSARPTRLKKIRHR